ncbi:MAG: 16S rRNA (uracil(1498)-N(3))-methyltransferase [Gammaproteobacteria bacterium]|nr:MAG: 16S rRNA (uracil(1498)-N(3))-methyltransferase [Gammaproteobacteria bacterium]
MRDIRLYVDLPLASGELIELPEQTARHAVTVLRLKTGDLVTLFNGEGGEYSASIHALQRRQVQLLIGEHLPVNRESALHTRLVQALGKGERTEWAIRKAVELGVTEIVPLATERTQVKTSSQKSDQRERRWHGLIVAACEQSGRTRLPLIRPIASFENWVSAERDGERIILDPRAGQGLSVNRKVTEVELLVGPEGGFSDQEYEFACQNNYQPASLGPRILRTETAPVAALAILQVQAGDWVSDPVSS